MTRTARLIRTLTSAVLLATLGLAGLFALTTQPASAAPRVDISGTPSAEGQSELQLSGSGFQSIEGGFGGVYVLFGWVDDPSGGSWRPSQGGITGEDYRYQYDDETNPEGFQLYVHFPGSSTAAAANGGEVSADGTWSASIKLQGAQFDSFDRQQNRTTVDCLEVQCGIITIGAHGVKNANNESFTPVEFPGAPAATSGDEDSTEDEAESEEAAEESADEEQAADAPAATTTDQTLEETPVASPLIDPTAFAETNRLLMILVILAAVAVVLGISIIGLSFGIGGYLAAKSLLLGASPEALERERAKREKRAVRAREKRKRKVNEVRRREELKTAKAEAQGDSRVAREEIRHLPPAAESYDQIVKFFENDPNTPPVEPAYSGAPSGAFPVNGDAPTVVQPIAAPRTGAHSPAGPGNTMPGEPISTGPLDETPGGRRTRAEDNEENT